MQDNNVVVKTWGEARTDTELHSHVDLVRKLDIADLEKGSAVAGVPHPEPLPWSIVVEA